MAKYKDVRKSLEAKVRQGQARKDVTRDLVDQMLLYDTPIAGRYNFLDVIRILRDNCLPFNPGLEALIRGLSILEKYGKNLLRPEKPPQWRVVRLSNAIFKQEVDNVKGARKILGQLGYTTAVEDGLAYSDTQLIPDVPVVTGVTTDILLLRMELILLAHGEHRQEASFYSYIPAIEIKTVQEKMGVAAPETPIFQTPLPAETPMFHTPLPPPPTYHQVVEGAGTRGSAFEIYPHPHASTESSDIHAAGVPEPAHQDIPQDELCDLCGQVPPVVKCEICRSVYCEDCNNLWHGNPKRRNHRDKLISYKPKIKISSMEAVETRPIQPLVPQPPSITTAAPNDDDFVAWMNEKAVEIINISDENRKRQRLEDCLAELDEKASRYQTVIDTLMSQPSSNKKENLFHHVTDKLQEIIDAKEQFRILCGVMDVPERRPRQSASYQKTRPQQPRQTHYSNPSLDNRGSACSNVVLPVDEGSLIDLDPPPAEPFEPLSHTSPGDNQILLAEQTTSLKRNIDDEQSGSYQPAKVQRNGETAPQSARISDEFGNMTIFEGAGNFDDELSASLKNRSEARSREFISNLPKDELQRKIRQEGVRYQTTQFLDHVRAGDVSSFRPEQVEVALRELDKTNSSNLATPNSWLERNWTDQVRDFIRLAKEKGFRINPEDAEDILIEADNVFEKALELVVTAQNEQIADVAGEFGFETAKKALTKHKGDKYLAVASMQKDKLVEFLSEFRESNNASEHESSDVATALEIEDDVRRRNAITALLQIPDGVYSDSLNHLIRVMPERLRDTLLEDAVEAIVDNEMVHDVDAAIRHLDNECAICMDRYPRSKLSCLPTCGENGCAYCLSCLQQHLALCVSERNVRDIVCPMCSNPDIGGVDEDTKTHFFNHIDAILRNMPDGRRVHGIYQDKMRDYTLMRMPNFRWCSHCSGGFQFDGADGNVKMLCPFCRKHTCYKCKKQWEPQHDGISCEQFQKWKEANDPEYQAAGLARHLRENGIDCPDCNYRYALAKGGCMHFKCTQCSHEFCSGCRQAFKHGRQCGKLPSCSSKGLHAHHPRDCLFYLRDWEPSKLVKLLKDNGIPIDTRGSQKKACDVMEQKETPDGLKDAPCGRPVEAGLAGLCKLHFIEYLVNLINTNGLDPADIMTVDQLKACLFREGVGDSMAQRGRESSQDFRKRMLAEVKRFPLQ